MARLRIRLSRAWWTGLVVLAAFVLAAVVSWNAEESSRHAQQRIREQAVISQLTQGINGVLTHERELAQLLATLPARSVRHWPVLSEPVLSDRATSAVGFVGIVNQAQVATWQRAHHTTIVAASSPGVFHVAPPRSEHWVVEQFTVQPGIGPGHVGLDMSANPMRESLMARAARTNVAVASPPLHLLSSAIDNAAVLVFDPVRTAAGVLRGWVLASYQPASLVASAVSADTGARLVIHDGTSVLSGGQLSGGITEALAVANRTWTVTAWAPAGGASILPLLLILLGAIIAAGITALMRIGDGRERYALALVDHHIGREREARAEIESALTRLQENERRLSETQTLAHLGSWELDPHSGRLHWSRELCEIAGQPEGHSPTYAEFLAQVHPDDRAGLESAVIAAGQSRPSTSEYRVIRPDASVRWVRTSRFSDTGPDGVARLRGATQDITDEKQAELALHAARVHAEAVTVAIAEGYGLTIDGRIAQVNPSLCEMTGFSADELIGTGAPWPFWPPELVEENLRRREAVIAEGGDTFEITLMRKDGSRFQAEMTARPAHNPDGSVLGFVTTIRDISARKAHELEDRAVRELAQLVARNSRPSEVFDRVAAYLMELFGCFSGVVVRFDAETRRGTFVTGLSHSDHLVRGAEVDLDGHTALARVFHTGASARSNGETSDGTDPQLADFVAEISDAVATPITVHGQLWGCIGAAFSRGPAPADTEQRLERFADLVAMAIANAEAWDALERQASTDSLTALANHRTFQEQLRAEIKRAERYGRALSLVLVDVDHFKSVNDTYGHQAGDSVLIELARLLRQHGRYGDLIARTGGEEFALLLPETDAIAALRMTERLRQAVQQHEFPGVGSLTISAGISALGREDEAVEIFRRADQSLYRAKHLGRNRSEVDERAIPASDQPGPGQAASSAAAR